MIWNFLKEVNLSNYRYHLTCFLPFNDLCPLLPDIPCHENNLKNILSFLLFQAGVYIWPEAEIFSCLEILVKYCMDFFSTSLCLYQISQIRQWTPLGQGIHLKLGHVPCNTVYFAVNFKSYWYKGNDCIGIICNILSVLVYHTIFNNVVLSLLLSVLLWRKRRAESVWLWVKVRITGPETLGCKRNLQPGRKVKDQMLSESQEKEIQRSPVTGIPVRSQEYGIWTQG